MPSADSSGSSRIPDWLIIMTVYSMVIVSILLISNVTPNGKLYIHFTAFWSMIIYFVLVKKIFQNHLKLLFHAVSVSHVLHSGRKFYTQLKR
jgi:hypothetical protein